MINIHKLNVEFDSSKLPTKLKLFSVGENKSSKGVSIYDPKLAESIKESSLQNTKLLSIDVNHLMLSENQVPEAYESQAWFELVCDDTGIWMDNIEWTTEGAEKILSKKFRYLSPAFYTTKDGYISQVVNASLTCTPATFDAAPIIMKKDIPMEEKDKEVVTEDVKKCSTLTDEQIAAYDVENLDLTALTPEELMITAEAFKAMVTELKTGKSEDETADEAGTEEKPMMNSEIVDEKTEKEILLNSMIVKRQLKNVKMKSILMKLSLSDIKEYAELNPGKETIKTLSVDVNQDDEAFYKRSGLRNPKSFKI